MLQLGKEEPQLPDVDPNEHLTQWLAELGFYQPTGQGVIGLPHTEIRAWAENIGLRLHGMEAAWLAEMSRAYANEVSRSEGKNAKAPYTGETT